MEKNKLMMIIIIVLLVIMIGAIGAVSVFAFKMLKSGGEQEKNQATMAVEAQKDLDVDEITTITVPDQIIVNLSDSPNGDSHSVTLTVGISVDNTVKKESEALIASINDQEIIVKDAVISILHTKTMEELSQPDSQAILKQEILEKLQDEFKSNLIYKVFFGNMYYE